MVDGKPAIKPPIFVPCFSARTVPMVIQRLPTIKERTSFNTKILSMSILSSYSSSLRWKISVLDKATNMPRTVMPNLKLTISPDIPSA